MEEFRRNGLTFDVREFGPKDGPVVVLLHGFPQSNAAWDEVAPLLAVEGYRCLAPNQRGYARKALPRRRRDYRLSELADDVLALIDAIGAERVHLVGHDMGAYAAWSFAARHGERLASVSALSTPHPRALHRAIFTSRQALASWYIFFVQLPAVPEWIFVGRNGKTALLGKTLRAGGQTAELAARDARGMAEPGALTGALNWYRAIPFADREHLVSVPSMYVWSDRDAYVREQASRICGNYVSGEYRYEVLAGVSHWLLEEQPATVAALLLEWFAEHPIDTAILHDEA